MALPPCSLVGCGCVEEAVQVEAAPQMWGKGPWGTAQPSVPTETRDFRPPPRPPPPRARHHRGSPAIAASPSRGAENGRQRGAARRGPVWPPAAPFDPLGPARMGEKLRVRLHTQKKKMKLRRVTAPPPAPPPHRAPGGPRPRSSGAGRAPRWAPPAPAAARPPPPRQVAPRRRFIPCVPPAGFQPQIRHRSHSPPYRTLGKKKPGRQRVSCSTIATFIWT